MVGSYYDRQGNPLTMEEWVQLHSGDKTVAKTQVGEYLVSTVWLGLDHSFSGAGAPLIFETMVFDQTPGTPRKWSDELLERYPTEAAALAGHDQVVQLVRTWPSSGAVS